MAGFELFVGHIGVRVLLQAAVQRLAVERGRRVSVFGPADHEDRDAGERRGQPHQGEPVRVGVDLADQLLGGDAGNGRGVIVQEILDHVSGHDRLAVPDRKPSDIAGKHHNERFGLGMRGSGLRADKAAHAVTKKGDAFGVRGGQIVVSGLSVFERVLKAVSAVTSAGTAEGKAQYAESVKT